MTIAAFKAIPSTARPQVYVVVLAAGGRGMGWSCHAFNYSISVNLPPSVPSGLMITNAVPDRLTVKHRS